MKEIKTVRPMGDRVIVLRDAPDAVTDGGIIIPDTAQEKPYFGTVDAVGPGEYRDGVFVATSLKPGDEVMFPKYAGIDFNRNGKEFVVLREVDIIAVLERE